MPPLNTMHGLLAALPQDTKESCGSFRNTNLVPVDLINSLVKITVRGFVAHLSIDLTYHNTCGQTVEVTYMCPTDAKSAIFEFRAEINGRTIHSHCVAREKAETLYKDAVKSGQSAIIATETEHSSDILQMSLGNLEKDTEAKIHLEMVMELPVETDGAVRFTLPVVFNPRYSPTSDIPKPIAATKNTTQPELNTILVEAKVEGSLKIDRIVSSSTFDVHITEEGTQAVLTNVIFDSKVQDWSFNVYYHSPHQPHALKETCDRSSSGMMADDILMINLFPELPSDVYSPHNEINFLVDCSGSMQGSNIKNARNSLLLFLKSLPSGCRFNIICFGSNYRTLFESNSERYTEETLKTALKFQSKIDADMGGTEIFDALNFIYRKEVTPGYARQILVLTDGQVWNVNEIMDLVARNSGDTRMFSVGIGDGASTALVQGLARAGNGRHEMVNDVSQLQIKLMGLLASMLQRSVTNVSAKITLEPPKEIELIPKIPPIIFGGQHLILYARAPPKSIFKGVIITGKVGDKTVSYEVQEGNCKQIHDEKFSLHRLAAKRQIMDWQLTNDDYFEGAAKVHIFLIHCGSLSKHVDPIEDYVNKNEELIGLSTTSGIVCRLTAFVGIDQEGKSYQKSKEEKHVEEGKAMKQVSRIGRAAKCAGAAASEMMMLRKTDEKKKSTNVLHNLGGILSKNKKADKKCYGAVRKSCVSDEALDCGEALEAEEALDSDKRDNLLQVIMDQNFDGSWSLEVYSNTLNLSTKSMQLLQDIRQKKKLNDTIFTTAVCLAWFRSFHLERKPEWAIVSHKGEQFLQKQNVDVTDLIDKFVSALNAK